MRGAPRDERGVPLSIRELQADGALPVSRLNLEKDKSFNNHHRVWERKKYGTHAVLQCLRDLEAHQERVPRDVHTLYHQEYQPPPLIGLKAAADMVMRGYIEGVRRQVYNLKTGQYETSPIPYELIAQIDREYGGYE